MLIITTTMLCAMALLHVALSFMIIKLRRTALIGLNHGDNPRLATLMRVQTNHIEYSVWVIPLLALQEWQQALPLFTLLILAVGYVLTRLWYTYAFVRTNARKSYGRFVGTFMAINVIGVLVMTNLYRVFAG